jgi:hypothetical protein
MTADGQRAITEAAPHHVETLRRHFIDLLSKSDVKALKRIAAAVLGELPAP